MRTNMDRRRFVKIALAGAAAPVASGCVGGDEGSPGGENNTTDTGGNGSSSDDNLAEFGYETWVPSGSYTKLAYADLARLRDWRTLETDEETAALAGNAGPAFADVDRHISTNTDDAYSGSFDADALTSDVSEALTDPEESEYRGYTVVRGTEDGDDTEVVISDSFVVSSAQGEGGATGYVDAALGEAERAAEVSQPIQDVSDYVSDPLLVVITPNPGVGRSAMYTYIEATEGRLDLVEVTIPVLDSEEKRQEFLNQSPRRKYNESTLTPEERNTTTRVQNRTGVLSSPAGDVNQYLKSHF